MIYYILESVEPSAPNQFLYGSDSLVVLSEMVHHAMNNGNHHENFQAYTDFAEAFEIYAIDGNRQLRSRYDLKDLYSKTGNEIADRILQS